MTRRKMTIEEIREEFGWAIENPDEVGVMALVDVEDMGWCKDDCTRWYHFNDINGNPAVYYKY